MKKLILFFVLGWLNLMAIVEQLSVDSNPDNYCQLKTLTSTQVANYQRNFGEQSDGMSKVTLYCYLVDAQDGYINVREGENTYSSIVVQLKNGMILDGAQLSRTGNWYWFHNIGGTNGQRYHGNIHHSGLKGGWFTFTRKENIYQRSHFEVCDQYKKLTAAQLGTKLKQNYFPLSCQYQIENYLFEQLDQDQWSYLPVMKQILNEGNIEGFNAMIHGKFMESPCKYSWFLKDSELIGSIVGEISIAGLEVAHIQKINKAKQICQLSKQEQKGLDKLKYILENEFILYPGVYVMAKEGFVNVRAKANSQSQILSKISNGQLLSSDQFIRRQGEWYLFLFSDKQNNQHYEGYVHRSGLN